MQSVQENIDFNTRKHLILTYARNIAARIRPMTRKFNVAIDVGCGDGGITKDLPARIIHGYEVNNDFAEQLPGHVKRVMEIAPSYGYDLVVASEVLYPHYGGEGLWEQINATEPECILLLHDLQTEIEQVKFLQPVLTFTGADGKVKVVRVWTPYPLDIP